MSFRIQVQNVLGLIFLLGTFSEMAQAAGGTVTFDKGRMPRCIESSKSPEKSLIFFWNAANPYAREIFATTIEVSHLIDNSTNHNCAAIKKYFDEHAPSVQNFNNGNGDLVAQGISVATTDDENFTWNDDVNERFAQVRLGSNIYHDFSADEYLIAHPVLDFTRDTNRALVKDYGIGFTADIFKSWIVAQSDNTDFANKIDSTISKISKLGNHELVQNFSGYKVLIAQGFMQTAKDNRLKNLMDELSVLKVNFRQLDFDPIGAIPDNAKSFHDQIKAELSSPQKIILVSASEGSPEILTALAELNTEGVLANSPGKISAVITLSGMIQGSFMVDWASHFPQNLMIKKTLSKGAVQSELTITQLNGFFDMSTNFLEAQVLIYQPHLPDLRYFSFVGVLTHDGLAPDPEIGMLQKSLSIPKIGFQGANDGYIEYPGTVIPKAWSLRSTDIVFDASHAVLDGRYNGHDMQNALERKLVLDGIFQTIINDIEKK